MVSSTEWFQVPSGFKYRVVSRTEPELPTVCVAALSP
jgi:hypothetical protein